MSHIWFWRAIGRACSLERDLVLLRDELSMDDTTDAFCSRNPDGYQIFTITSCGRCEAMGRESLSFDSGSPRLLPIGGPPGPDSDARPPVKLICNRHVKCTCTLRSCSGTADSHSALRRGTNEKVAWLVHFATCLAPSLCGKECY